MLDNQIIHPAGRRGCPSRKKNPNQPAREIHQIDRALEFFSADELAKQIGSDVPLWPSALLLELIANGLDAAEQYTATPTINVTVGEDWFSVEDNGPGIPWSVVESSTNYTTRTTDKAYYPSPTRGRQGNALKTVWAAPYALSRELGEGGEFGRVTVEAHRQMRKVEVMTNRIAQIPSVIVTNPVPSDVKTGTKITTHWPEEACSLTDPEPVDFYTDDGEGDEKRDEAGGRTAAGLVRAFALFNPHAEFNLNLPGTELEHITARSTGWRKWMASDPVPVQWYTAGTFADLMAACLRADLAARKPARSVRQFLGQFRGITGSLKPKQICEAAGLEPNTTIADVLEDEERDDLGRLLTAAGEETDGRQPQPKHLGIIGKDAFVGGVRRIYGCGADGIRYARQTGVDGNGVPWVLEVGFGYLDNTNTAAVIAAGLNWSPALRVPFDSLRSAMQDNRVDDCDPVVLAVHLVYPAARATDRGKSRYELPDCIDNAVAELVRKVATEWKKAKDKVAREERRLDRREIEDARRGKRSQKRVVKEVAYEVMPEAYRRASEGSGVAEARQVMYAARKMIIDRTAIAEPWKNAQRFTQTLLPDFMAEYSELTANWDVVFGNRGHFAEPHTGKQIEIGTLSVRREIGSWPLCKPGKLLEMIRLERAYPTAGPRSRYKYVLFLEKEGFHHHIERAGIQERYDVALMSTKGMTVTASRKLVDELSGLRVTTIVMRDFDKSGFSIANSLMRSGRRYKFKNKPLVIDVGLRLADVKRLGLTGEKVGYTKIKKDPRIKLRECGASEEECNFLVSRQTGPRSWEGTRVELNELIGDTFIWFLEEKFKEIGVRKVVPDPATLAEAYQRAARVAVVQRKVEEAVEEANDTEFEAPEDLAEQIEKRLTAEPSLSWDEAVYQTAKENETKAA